MTKIKTVFFKKKLKSIRRMLFVCLGMTLLLIWGHSCVPRPISAAESGHFVEWLEPVFTSYSIDAETADHIVRKCAHFIEYFVLGSELELIIIVQAKIKQGAGSPKSDDAIVPVLTTLSDRSSFPEYKKTVFAAANYALYVALVDETIQIFSLRGSMVSDIWLDLFGGLCGAAAAYAAVGRVLCRKQSVQDMETDTE